LISGTPGAHGSVTAAVYGGNPQADASVPGGVSLNKFIAISFSMSAADFSQATITLNYTDSDVQDLQSPYAIYKYVPSTNSFVELPSAVDASAKTITATLVSINDPLLAIGGTESSTGGVAAITWAIIIVAVIAVILVAVFVFSRVGRPSRSSDLFFES
jgi:uncharacterized integral membrane protein